MKKLLVLMCIGGTLSACNSGSAMNPIGSSTGGQGLMGQQYKTHAPSSVGVVNELYLNDMATIPNKTSSGKTDLAVVGEDASGDAVIYVNSNDVTSNKQSISWHMYPLATSRSQNGINYIKACGTETNFPFFITAGDEQSVYIGTRQHHSKLTFDQVTVPGGKPVIFSSVACSQNIDQDGKVHVFMIGDSPDVNGTKQVVFNGAIGAADTSLHLEPVSSLASLSSEWIINKLAYGADTLVAIGYKRGEEPNQLLSSAIIIKSSNFGNTWSTVHQYPANSNFGGPTAISYSPHSAISNDDDISDAFVIGTTKGMAFLTPNSTTVHEAPYSTLNDSEGQIRSLACDGISCLGALIGHSLHSPYATLAYTVFITGTNSSNILKVHYSPFNAVSYDFSTYSDSLNAYYIVKGNTLYVSPTGDSQYRIATSKIDPN